MPYSGRRWGLPPRDIGYILKKLFSDQHLPRRYASILSGLRNAIKTSERPQIIHPNSFLAPAFGDHCIDPNLQSEKNGWLEKKSDYIHTRDLLANHIKT